MAPTFRYETSTQRYRYTSGLRKGQFVSEEQIIKLTQSVIASNKQSVMKVADSLIGGKINLAEWEKQTVIALKEMHIQSYLLGRGGLKNITPNDYNIIENKLQSEYKYLRKFAQDIINVGMSSAQFAARLNLYLESAQGTYELGRFHAHLTAGYNWEKRIRTKTESCDDCIMWAGMGWQPIGSLPNRGEKCQCRSRCGCKKLYSEEKPKDSLLMPIGWLRGDK